MTDDPGILDLPVPEGEGLYRQVKIAVGLDDPDLRTNPIFRLKRLVYGRRWMESVLRAASGARDVADLGSGSGWVALELAYRNPQSRILAVDRDAGLQEWARVHAEQRGRKVRLGQLTHQVADLRTLELPEGSLDAAFALFSLSSLPEPVQLLRRIRTWLSPGGLLVYMDATDIPERNVRRLARLTRRSRESLREAYASDGVRRHRPQGAPPEAEVFEALREGFEVLVHQRSRAFLDFFTGRYRVREALWRLPLLAAADGLAVRLGLLEGAVRHVLARRPT